MTYRHKKKVTTKETTVETWNRMYKVIFSNPKVGTPSAKFGITSYSEEDGVVTEGKSVQVSADVNPSDTFFLRDNNGDVTGEMQAKDLWKAIKSYYYHLDQEV